MKVLKWLDRNFELTISGIVLVIMTVIIVADVFMRNLFGLGITWGQELARTCTIIIAAMGMSYGAGAEKHIKVDILETFIPRATPFFHIFADVVTLIFCAFIGYHGISKLQDVYRLGTLTPVMQIPQFYIYLMMEIGLVLGVVRIIQKNLRRIKAKKEGGEKK